MLYCDSDNVAVKVICLFVLPVTARQPPYLSSTAENQNGPVVCTSLCMPRPDESYHLFWQLLYPVKLHRACRLA